jgi:hypothetical protein
MASLSPALERSPKREEGEREGDALARTRWRARATYESDVAASDWSMCGSRCNYLF